MTYLGIDLGTSSVKVLLIDEAQTILGSSSAPISVSRPHAGWSEQGPADWISATKTALHEVRLAQQDAFSAVIGIGLSGHMHGATLLDQEGEVLRPCMMWNDTRSFEEAASLDGDPAFQEISGNIVFPGFTAPKVDWVKNNEPEVFAKIAKVLLPKDYLRHWLTGDYVSEMSDAAGTSWLDVARRCWSSELLEKCDLRKDQMPDLVEGSDVSGTVRPEIADEFGLDQKTIVAGGAGDNAAAAIGMGAVNPGDAFLSLGTSGVLFAVNDAYRPNPKSAIHAFCHSVPNTWHQMGVILSATDALNWLSGVTDKPAAELDEALPHALEAPSGLTFLPYLSGERTPHNDAKIRGVLMGLHHDADTLTLTKAVLEGVSYAFADCLAALVEAGTKIHRVTAVGGGANSHYWLELLATVLNVEIDVPKDGDFGAAFGAARLGLIASTGASASEICTKPEFATTIIPNASQVSNYKEALNKYRMLYPAIANLS